MIEGKTKAERWAKVLKNPKIIMPYLMAMSPEQQLLNQIRGHLGSIAGLIFAWIFIVIKGFWYFSIVMFFGIFLQFISYIGVRQKYQNIMRMQLEDVKERL